MFKWLGFPWNLVAYAVTAMVVLGTMWWSWDHYIANPYIAKGVAQEHVQTVKAEAANVSLAAERDALKQQLADARAAGATEAKRLADAKAAADKKAAAKVKTLQGEVDQLAAAASAPPAPTKEKACDATNALLDEYSARRLRHD